MIQPLLFAGETSQSQQSTIDLMNENIPYHAAEALLEEYLLKEFSDFEMLGIDAVNESNVNCKWRYSSAMQKSIRRGYVEDAVRFAMTYHVADPTGFWVRLCIVAFEDVGIADIWAVASTLAIARSKSFRQRLGGETICVQYIVKKLTEVVKDRTVCDLFQVIENRSIIPKHLTVLMSATPQDLSEIALSDKYHFESRIAAAWCLFGTGKFKNERLPFRSGERDLFDSTIERLKIPGLVKYITLRGMIACRCAMNLTYPFVWLMMEKSKYRRVLETELPEIFYIKGLPDFAYDKHTREGKAAYQHYYKSCSAVNDFLTGVGIVGNDAVIKAIGIAVFISESALLGKRIDFEGAQQVYMMTVEDDYKNNGLTPTDGMELSTLIQENYESLRRSRQIVVEGKSR